MHHKWNWFSITFLEAQRLMRLLWIQHLSFSNIWKSVNIAFNMHFYWIFSGILGFLGFEKIGITEIRACIDNFSSVGIRDLELPNDFLERLENYSDLLSDKPENSAFSRLSDFQFPWSHTTFKLLLKSPFEDYGKRAI